MRKSFAKDLKSGQDINTSFMIKKIFTREENNLIGIIGDKTGEFRASIPDEQRNFGLGDIINVKGTYRSNFTADKSDKLTEYNIEDYLPNVERPIDDIMNEIDQISKEEFITPEAIALNNYFFKNNDFVDRFKRAIGGVSQHHNYIGGLAEHTLNVMYLTKTMAYRYNTRNKEIAILGAKLHDIGKIEEMTYDGAFTYTLKGSMEGHIVIGVTMIEMAFKENPSLYSEDFMERIKGCIVQHHGKVEYGSPQPPKLEESYIVHFADYVDAMLNKISIITKDTRPNSWTPFERRIDGKLYV